MSSYHGLELVYPPQIDSNRLHHTMFLGMVWLQNLDFCSLLPRKSPHLVLLQWTHFSDNTREPVIQIINQSQVPILQISIHCFVGQFLTLLFEDSFVLYFLIRKNYCHTVDTTAVKVWSFAYVLNVLKPSYVAFCFIIHDFWGRCLDKTKALAKQNAVSLLRKKRP